MKKTFFFVAIAGWLLGLMVHLLSIAGVNVIDKVPFVWVLHLGIFAVFIPAMVDLSGRPAMKARRKADFRTRMQASGFYKIVFSQTPTWLTMLTAAGFVYAVINFLWVFSSFAGVPEIENGHYVLQNHGKLIKTLTEQEYHWHKAMELRGFSGHWLAFYGISAAILYPFKKQPDNLV